jgi:hypothetical protein
MINALVHPRVLATQSASATVACTTGKTWPQDAQLRELAMHGSPRAYIHLGTRPRGTPPA